MRTSGFTLIELLVVMAIIAVLLSYVGPRYFAHVDSAKEAALKTNLRQIRDSIDKFYGDTGRYPSSLEQLASARYLRDIPVDPFTERRDTWVVLPPTDRSLGGVYDVRSGAQHVARDGTAVALW